MSAAGMPNFGDDAITRHWIGYLRRRFPGCQIYLDAIDATVASFLHPSVTCVDLVWRIAEWSRFDDPIATRDALRSGWLAAGPLPMRERQLLALMRDVDSVHFLGGGYINDLWPKNRNLIAVGSVLAERSGVTVFATGLGLQPLTGQSAVQLAEFLAGFSHIDVRDQASHDALAAHLRESEHGKLSCLGDDLLQVDPHDIVSVVDAPARMHLCVKNEFFDSEETAATVRRFVLSEVESFQADHPDAPVLCYELRPHFDYAIYEFLGSHIGNVVLVPFEQIWADGMTLGRSDRLLSSRYHFQLLAAATGLDGTALSWSTYYDEKFLSLRAFSRWRVLRLEQGGFAEVEYPEAPDGAPDAAELGRRKREFVASRLYPPSRAR